VHDHRLPRHDRPPETWLPHPGTPEPSSHVPMPLVGDAWPPAPTPAPWHGNAPTSLRPPLLAADASPFARFIAGLVAGRKSVPLAAVLGLMGPLGLFYVSFLHGVAALVVVPFFARTVAAVAAQAVGAGPDVVVTVAIVVCWLITVPWAILAARRRNARRGF